MSVEITASCLWTWFAGIHLWIQQTKHLQCSLFEMELERNLLERNLLEHKLDLEAMKRTIIIGYLFAFN